ncbi:MAG: translation initiation factor IF-2 [Cytophagales bacterium]
MSEEKTVRLGQIARQINVGISTIADFLVNKGFKDVEANPNTKITTEQLKLVQKEYQTDKDTKTAASSVTINKKHNENFTIKAESHAGTTKKKEEDEEILIKNVSTPENEKVETTKVQLTGPKIIGKIDLDAKKKPEIQPKVEQKDTFKKPEIQPVVENTTKAPEKEIEKPVEKPVAQIQVSEEQKPVEKVQVEVKVEIKPQTPVAPIEKPQEVKSEPVSQKPNNTPNPTEKAVSNTSQTPAQQPTPAAEPEIELVRAEADQLRGLKVLGKIEIPTENKPKKKEDFKKDFKKGGHHGNNPGNNHGNNQGNTNQGNNSDNSDKKKRKRVEFTKKPESVQNNNSGGNNNNNSGGNNNNSGNRNHHHNNNGGHNNNRNHNNRNHNNNNNNNNNKKFEKPEVTQKEIQDKLKDTLAKIGVAKKDNSGFANRSKYRKEKRQSRADAHEERMQQEKEASKVLKVTEFVSTSDLASLMNVSVNQIIATCMSLGMFVSINQRLDAEVITLIADEFGYATQFVSAEEDEAIIEEQDQEEDLETRAPIVTIMGHVDHGKTSLLDYIRESNVVSSEAGGITQHIGAYSVKTEGGKRITFLDTPGHEAFTAMRARGAKVTDVVIVVIAADDSIMPQTKEAINHAQVAGVPIIFALNKIDKPGANPDKIREQLAAMNMLVEEWGGKYQCQEISAKKGIGINELLEKVLLESELLDLKANPNKKAVGAVIEASLDKGRGYVTTILVQSGTLRVGDIILAGNHFGKVKAMTDHKGKKLTEAEPSRPVQVLGLGGAPTAGDKVNVMDSDREAREVANRREQLMREQSVRTKKHITLDEIGRRLAIGNFKELNIIVKGDVDGSIEALSDSLLKLSTDEIGVNILHKGVGQISETDVLLASASDAIIVGFQVRPSASAKKLAEAEQIEVRLYSIIYDAINEVKDAMEGMLAPKVEEVVVGSIEVRDVFKISKVGTIAGCYVLEGNVKRNNRVRIIRDGIVVHTGEILALKRFKDDVSEVKFGYECGLSIKNFNDINMGDIIEAFEEKEIKRKLA